MTEVEVYQLRLDKRGRLNWKKTRAPFRGRPKNNRLKADQNHETLDCKRTAKERKSEAQSS